MHWERMELAVRLARYALDHGETPVACVFFYEPLGEVIAYGMNDTNRSLTGIAHAEFMAMDQLRCILGGSAELARVAQGITVYVTVEPCIMCASALRQLGIKKVVFGCANERFGGNGTVLRCNKDHSTTGEPYESIPGIMRREAIMLLRYFYVRSNEKAPRPKNKTERRLDRENFPALEWSRYLDESSFIQEFSDRNKEHYITRTDVNGEVNWSLIDEPCEGIIDELDKRCNYFVEHTNKKIKC